MLQQQTDQEEKFPPASPRWQRIRLASAHDSAAECLWAEITNACQRSLSRSARIEAAVAAVFALFEADPALARLLVLTAPVSAETQLVDRHRLLRDHLVDLLQASRAKAPPGVDEEGAAREAIEQAFTLTAARLGQSGVGGLSGLVAPLAKLLVGKAG